MQGLAPFLAFTVLPTGLLSFTHLPPPAAPQSRWPA